MAFVESEWLYNSLDYIGYERHVQKNILIFEDKTKMANEPSTGYLL